MNVINCTQNSNKQTFGCKSCDKAASFMFDNVAGVKKWWTKAYLEDRFNGPTHEKDVKEYLRLIKTCSKKLLHAKAENIREFRAWVEKSIFV